MASVRREHFGVGGLVWRERSLDLSENNLS